MTPTLMTEELLALRERQLAACTRAMREAATALRDGAQGRLDDCETMYAVADDLMRARAGVQAPAPELAVYHGRLYLLTPSQALALDAAIMQQATDGTGNLRKVLEGVENHQLDAARKL